MKKNCLQCNTEFTARRSDAKFCSSICRSKYWIKNNNPKQEIPSVQTQLRGLLSETNKEALVQKRLVEEKTENLQYKTLKKQIADPI